MLIVNKFNKKKSVIETCLIGWFKCRPHINEAYMFPWWARHETPVLASPLRIIHVDEELLVLDKPCSLPVSQCVGTV